MVNVPTDIYRIFGKRFLIFFRVLMLGFAMFFKNVIWLLIILQTKEPVICVWIFGLIVFFLEDLKVCCALTNVLYFMCN